jgi:DNA-binding NarL/FixJ family response regulator
MKKILLVDDHPLLREGLARLIGAQVGFTVCGMAATVQEALALVDSEHPDLIITDLILPGRNGLELIKDLGATHPHLPVIVLSMHDELMYAERVLRAGGRGYVMKDTPPERLVQAINVVLAGGVFASQALADHFLQTLVPARCSPKPSFPLERLTDRELEVFELIGQAKGNQEIATQLHISPRTLDAHRAHIREKLGLADGNELIRYAIRWVEVGNGL